MRLSSVGARVVAAGLIAAVAAGCATGPSLRPELALSGRSDGVPAQPGPDDDGDDQGTELPPIPVPAGEPEWGSCAGEPVDVPNGPDTPDVQCATLFGALDTETGSGSIHIELLRALPAGADEKAGPVVLTVGADGSSRQSAIDLAAGPGAPDRPVVGIERRGMGLPTAPDCLTETELIGLTAAGAPARTPDTRAAAMNELVTGATVACTDILRPTLTSHDAAAAAADIETLRQIWEVDQVAVLALGSGVEVALGYAARFPNTLARLVLDSPTPVQTDPRAIAEGRARAGEATLAALASWCAGRGCALGPDPAGALTELFDRAGSGDLGPVTVGALRTVIDAHVTARGTDFDTAAAELTDLLAAVAADEPGARADVGAAVAVTDGQFTAICSDSFGEASQADAAEAAQEWAEQYPHLGTDAAMRMLLCGSWPAQDAAELPDSIAVPVLLVSGANDPVAGAGAVDPVVSTVQRAGAQTATIGWAGTGHGGMWRSACVGDEVREYLASGRIPQIGPSCPA